MDAGAEANDWAWRRRIRADPRTRAIYRAFVGVVGTGVMLLGFVLIPFPGPGWAVVFLGLAILASEFRWARRLLDIGRDLVRRWSSWVGRQPVPFRALLGVVTLAFTVTLVWVALRVLGIPGFVPSGWVPSWTGLGE